MLTPYPLEPPPFLPPLDGPWEGPDAPLLSGRRVRLEDEVITFDTAVGCRDWTAGGVEQERRLLALDEPCFIWEGTGKGTVTCSAALLLPVSDIRVERSDDGSRLWLGATTDPVELLCGASGGTVAVVERDGGPRLEARGEGRLRVVVIAAAAETDREQVLRGLARKGFAGLRDQRRRHADQIDALSLKQHTPESAGDLALRDLAHRLDAELRRAPTGRCTFADPLATGTGLLAMGLREPVRDVLRGGFDDPRLIELFVGYATWSGPDEFCRKHWPRVEEALRIAPDAGRARLAALLLPVAEGLGMGSAVTTIGRWWTAGGSPVAPAPNIPREIQDRWRLAPDAIDGAITLAPELPVGWPEMTLERLRVGPSTLDVKVRRRPAGIAVKCRLTHGPAVVVQLRPRLPFIPSGILLHDAQLPGPGLSLTLADEAEAVWLT